MWKLCSGLYDLYPYVFICCHNYLALQSASNMTRTLQLIRWGGGFEGGQILPSSSPDLRNTLKEFEIYNSQKEGTTLSQTPNTIDWMGGRGCNLFEGPSPPRHKKDYQVQPRKIHLSATVVHPLQAGHPSRIMGDKSARDPMRKAQIPSWIVNFFPRWRLVEYRPMGKVQPYLSFVTGTNNWVKI